MYTTDHLIEDCVGQFIESQPYSINRSSLLNDRQYCEIWTCLLQWTEKQIKRKNSFIMPHFGLIKYSNAENYKLYLQSSYITELNAKLGSSTDVDIINDDELHNSSAIKCHISSLMKYSSSLSESQLQVGLKHIFSKLQQQIGRSAISTKNYHDIDNFEPHLKIIINFGWAYLSVSDGVIDFVFTMNESLIVNPKIPTALKNIPKQYLQSTSSLFSVASIPSNVKITSNTTTSGSTTKQCSKLEPYGQITKQLEKYKQKYKLPVDHDYDNPLIYLASRDTIPQSSHDKAQYPRVLSEFSRTLGSTYCTHTNYEAPSTKIGLFYTPTSSLYRININDKKIQYTDYLPFFQSNAEKYYEQNSQKLLKYELKYKTKHANHDEREQENHTALDLDIAASCKRYHEYIHHRMPHDFIPPLRDDLIAKILNRLEPDLTLITQDQVEKILEENLNIIQSQNLIAIKQSILDYILKNNNERTRLNIIIPPHHIHQWGHSPLPYSAPLSWGRRLQQAWNNMNESSYFVNRGMIEMLHLWQNYKHYRLFGTPCILEQDVQHKLDISNMMASSSDASENADNDKVSNATQHLMKNIHDTILMPMSIQQFREQQEEHLEFVRNVFLNNWYNDSVAIMKKYVEENVLDSSEESTLKLFSAIAAFMSTKLCEIVYQSLRDCITFFEQYMKAPLAISSTTAHSSQSVLDIESVPFNVARQIQPVWKIGMEVSRNGIEYEIGLQEIDVAVNDMIENIITCFDNIQCVEGKIFGLLENVSNLSVFIDHDIQSETRMKISKITGSFIKELKYLQGLYSNEFSPLFGANEELTQRLMEIENDDSIHDKQSSLTAFKKEIEKYQVIQRDVREKAQLNLRMGLFEVECSNINALIIDHAQDLKNGITNHVAKQMVDKAGKLVIEFENGSKKLLKKPESAQDLVDLVDYMELFDTSELEQWQDIADEIGKELKFLFETDHSLSHDLLRSVGRVSDWNKKITQHRETAKENSITQRQFIETTIIEKSKQFELKIKKMYQQVEDLQLLSEIRDVSKINELKEEMESVIQEKEFLNTQQELLQIEISEFKTFHLLKESVSKL